MPSYLLPTPQGPPLDQRFNTVYKGLCPTPTTSRCVERETLGERGWGGVGRRDGILLDGIRTPRAAKSCWAVGTTSRARRGHPPSWRALRAVCPVLSFPLRRDPSGFSFVPSPLWTPTPLRCPEQAVFLDSLHSTLCFLWPPPAVPSPTPPGGGRVRSFPSPLPAPPRPCF